ncbi:hypothetical protein AB0M28_27015, partial [Streptomyces sp. NPDC051940]|uniref:hypothetical protein n=1 Tax=Streptomyces sp. NPDC051940 TaxID=3155675 RepID=UPI00341957FC
VELAVEKELGFSGKQDIERYGIAEFNAKCREAVRSRVGGPALRQSSSRTVALAMPPPSHMDCRP